MVKCDKGEVTLNGPANEIQAEIGTLLDSAIKEFHMTRKQYDEFCERAWRVSQITSEDRRDFLKSLAQEIGNVIMGEKSVDDIEIHFKDEK